MSTDRCLLDRTSLRDGWCSVCATAAASRMHADMLRLSAHARSWARLGSAVAATFAQLAASRARTLRPELRSRRARIPGRDERRAS